MATDERVIDAAREYLARRDRRKHPAGEFDKAKRWDPAATEEQTCCRSIRTPSRGWPYSLLVHCRTLNHVARLYNVPAADVRRTVKSVELMDALAKI